MNKTFSNNGEKPKSIIINGELHNHFKLYCKGKSMKIGGVIEDLIKLYLTDSKNLQTMIDNMKEHSETENFRIKIRDTMKKSL